MSKKPTLALTKKFIEGLKKYNLTYNDIVFCLKSDFNSSAQFKCFFFIIYHAFIV